jgi:hypothetical protein
MFILTCEQNAACRVLVASMRLGLFPFFMMVDQLKETYSEEEVDLFVEIACCWIQLTYGEK